MKHNFEERRQHRKEWAEMQAAKNREESNASYQRADELAKMIPMGQPILIGHHSERRHRAHLKKIDNAMRKSVNALSKAGYYAGRAATIESNTAIFSDDPNALDLLRKKLEALVELQGLMKEANRVIRKYKSNSDKQIEALKDLGFSDAKIIELLAPSSRIRVGYPQYKLTNNLANIKRIRVRISQMERAATMETTSETFGEIRIVRNFEANRLQIFFQGIPSDETRKRLKGHGFRWCRSEGAWQRHLNETAYYWAKSIVTDLIKTA